MQVVLAIAVLVGLALLSAGMARRAIGNRLAAMAVSGLWGAGIIGLLLGPSASGLINAGTRDNPGTRDLATPLVVVTLGWVGMMIGLQVRRDVLKRVPAEVWRLVRIDALATILVWMPIAATLVWWAFDGTQADARLAVAVALVAALMGWSSETRSLRPEGLGHATIAEYAVRGSGALASIVAVCAFGAGVLGVDAVRRALVDPSFVAVGILGTISWLALIVIAGGLLGRLGLSLAGRSRGNQLVAFLGTVALVAGLAAKIGISSLLCAAIVGSIIGSARGFGAREFERYLLSAELAIATLLGLLVGVACTVDIHAADMVIAGAIVAWRIGVKPRLARLGAPELATDRALTLGAIRPHPVGLAFALALTLHIESGAAARAGTILIVSAIACDLCARILSRRSTQVAAGAPAAPGVMA